MKAFALGIFEHLVELHGKGYIHRDLKQQQMLINFDEVRDPDSGKVNKRVTDVKLTDFGFTQKANDKGEVVSGFNRCGTGGYLPPELFLDKPQPHSYKSDVWSAAATLLSLFNNQALFYDPIGGGGGIWISSYKRGDIESELRRVRKRELRPWEEYLVKCLDSDPQQRPTAAEAHAELEKLFKEVP